MESADVKSDIENTAADRTDERKNLSYKHAFLWELLLYIGVFVVTTALFFILRPRMQQLRNGVTAQMLMVISLGLIASFISYMGVTKRLTAKKLILLLLLAGFVLRVGYMLYTPASARQQDTYTKNFDGHEAYAWTLFTTGRLPTTNDYQFYHPPLNALLQAGFMHFMKGLTDGIGSLFGLEDYFATGFLFAKPDYITENERWFLYSTCQILAVFYSFVTAAVSVKIVKMFRFSDKMTVFLSAFVIFYPRNIQFSGMLNNDGVSYMFSILSLFFALKWWKGNRSILSILFCALCVGLGMMAKFSSATVCLPIAGVFIYEFIRTLQKKTDAMPIGKMVLQYGAFLCVCAPIGLWFQVYANQRFGQELGYVFSNLNQKLYTGDHSFFERFFIAFDLSEYLGTLYCRPFEGNYNLFNYALRSSIFGEFSYWQGEGLAAAAILFAYAGALLLFIGLVWCAVLYFKGKKDERALWKREPPITGKDFLFVFLLMQSQALSEIYFYIKMPYGCTMDFRYIMPMILAIALTVGYVEKTLKNTENKWALALNRALTIAAVGLLASSALFYCVCI
ncbi:MAG: hypothetical protein IJX87_02070 [Clostridia bacterium]|nr:hypothetical protein [Clostridia bacterium]